MATTDDWAKLETAAQAWGSLRCLLDLRARVEALERRAATEESSATDVDSALLRTGMVTSSHLAIFRESWTVEPAPAPAADRPLWEAMWEAYVGGVHERFPRDAMRPNPPSIAEQAVQQLDDAVMRGDCIATTDAMPALRTALARLIELETLSDD